MATASAQKQCVLNSHKHFSITVIETMIKIELVLLTQNVGELCKRLQGGSRSGQ